MDNVDSYMNLIMTDAEEITKAKPLQIMAELSSEETMCCLSN